MKFLSDKTSITYKVCITFFVYMGIFSNGVCAVLVGVTMSDLIEFTNSDSVTYGSVFIVKSVSMCLSGLVSGWVCDVIVKLFKAKKGTFWPSLNHFYCIGILFMLVPNFILPTVRVTWINIGANFLSGVGMQIMYVINNVYLDFVWKGHSLGLIRALRNGLFFALVFSALMFPLIASRVFSTDYGAEVNIIIIYGVAICIFLVPLGIIMFESPEKETEEEENVVETTTNNDSKQNIAAQEDAEKKKKDELKNRDLAQKKKKNKTEKLFLRSLVVLFGGLSMTGNACVQNIPFFLLTTYCENIGMSKSLANIILSVFIGGNALSSLIGIIFSIFVQPHVIATVNTVWLLLGNVALCFYPRNATFVCLIHLIFVGEVGALASLTISCSKVFGIEFNGFENSMMVLGIALANFSPFPVNTLMSLYGDEFLFYSNTFVSVILLVVFVLYMVFGFVYKKKFGEDDEEKLVLMDFGKEKTIDINIIGIGLLENKKMEKRGKVLEFLRYVIFGDQKKEILFQKVQSLRRFERENKMEEYHFAMKEKEEGIVKVKINRKDKESFEAFILKELEKHA